LTESPIARAAIPRKEYLAVLGCCALGSLAAIEWSWRHGAMLNYGDALAHLHIARRVFDSHRPGLTQLGSVWLPLPHLLMIPFVAVYAWWANGIAGAIPSALAYLAACAGIYRLARRWLQPLAATVALAFFAANPNLLYLQTTAMTEPLFLCEMIWIVVWLVEWRSSIETDQRKTERLLLCIATVLVAAVFTRYDGWILALLAWTGIGVVMLRRGRLRSRAFWLASVVVIAAPIAWFVYNAVYFGDWLDFARGPYSARAIELRTASPGWPPHPGWHNPWVAMLFFVKGSEMDAAAAGWGNVLLALSVFGTAWGWLIARRRAFAWALFLWLPLPFYIYSVAYGSVPIFLPVWWPHSWYNTRYGMEMLPAFALGLGFAAHFAFTAVGEFKPSELKIKWTAFTASVLFAMIGLNAIELVRQHPLTYVEGVKNLESRRAFELEIPPALRSLLDKRPGGIVLMDTSVYPHLVALAGIPLRQTINESDKEFYSAALAAPAAHADLVLAFDGDEIDQAVHAHPDGLTAYRRFFAPGQASATIYVSDTPASSTLNKPARAVIASLKVIE
jgi:4-amino-4-deoxy-L-arabinose transferase-like glycosyltransferase